MAEDIIKIRGARAHNLKDVDVDIPRGKYVVITGLSGSGKSSLAFDTIYAEGQRRYMNTLSPYAKHFMGVLEKEAILFRAYWISFPPDHLEVPAFRSCTS